MTQEVLKLAPDALEDLPGFRADIDNAITDFKEALAQPAQEPVARVSGTHGGRFVYDPINRATILPVGMALYSAPLQRQWIWLSDADIAEVVDTTCEYTGSYEEYLIKKAERKIRSINNG